MGLQRLFQAGVEIPTLVESLEDMGEVLLGKAVKVGNNGIQFVNHILPDRVVLISRDCKCDKN